MTKIEDLSLTNNLSDTDLLVTWNGATRAIQAGDAATYFQTKIAGNFQPKNTMLTNLAGLGSSGVNNQYIVITGFNTVAAVSGANLLSNIGGQPVDPTLTALAGLTTSAGDYIEATGSDTFRVRKLTVATYAALTAIPAASRHDDMLVYVASRSADGDGGEGYWRFDAGSSATANGGTILAPDAGSGRWLRQYSGAASHYWFGAKGDGVTDDTAAVQAAQNANIALHDDDGIFLVSNVAIKVSTTGRCKYLRKAASTGDFCTSGAENIIVGIELDCNNVGSATDRIFYITHDGCQTTPDFIARNGVHNGVDVREAINVKIRGSVYDCVQTHVFAYANTKDVTGLEIDVLIDGVSLGTGQLNGGVKVHAVAYNIVTPIINAKVFLTESTSMPLNAVCIETIGYGPGVVIAPIVTGLAVGGSIGCTLGGSHNGVGIVTARGNHTIGLEIATGPGGIGSHGSRYVGSVSEAGASVGPSYNCQASGSNDIEFNARMSGSSTALDAQSAAVYVNNCQRAKISGHITKSGGLRLVRVIDSAELNLSGLIAVGSSTTRAIELTNSAGSCDNLRASGSQFSGITNFIQCSNTVDGGFFDDCKIDNSGLFIGGAPTLSNYRFSQTCKITTLPFGARVSSAHILSYKIGDYQYISLGAGVPEGFNTASPGSLHLDETNGAVFVKHSGTGSSGWLPLSAPVETTAANIAAIGAAINTTGKYTGKMVWDSTNNRMLRASGTAAADPWHVVDGSATVTPS